MGFGLLRIPYFPHYVFVSTIVGLLILIFSLISSQMRDLQRELVRLYAQIAKFSNIIKVNHKREEKSKESTQNEYSR